MRTTLFCLALVGCTGSGTDDPVDCTELTFYEDADADGFGAEEVRACSLPEGASTLGGDCDDGDDGIHPDATDIPCDALDQDCKDGPFMGDASVPTTHATLQDAVGMVETGGLICLEVGTHDTGGTRVSSKQLTILGAGAESTAIGGSGRALSIGDDADILLSGVSLDSSGGGFLVAPLGELTLEDFVVESVGCPDLACQGAIAQGMGPISVRGFEMRDVTVSATAVDALFHMSADLSVEDFVIEGVSVSATDEASGIITNDGGTTTLRNGLVSNSTFSSETNQAYLLGWLTGGSLQDVQFLDNEVASPLDDAIFAYSTDEPLALEQVRASGNAIMGNQTYFLYAAGSDLDLDNVLIADNHQLGPTNSTSYGWFMLGGHVAMDHTTVANNRIDNFIYSGALAYLNDWSGTSGMAATNSAIVGNLFDTGLSGSADVLFVARSDEPTFDYCFVGGNTNHDYYSDNSGNLGYSLADPGFVDATNGDYRLVSGSPMEDAGLGTDLDGTAADIGVYGGPGVDW